jgi:hypothetical protein
MRSEHIAVTPDCSMTRVPHSWEPVKPGDPDHMPNGQRLLHVVADRQKWHAALTNARARASGETDPDLSAAGTAA